MGAPWCTRSWPSVDPMHRFALCWPPCTQVGVNQKMSKDDRIAQIADNVMNREVAYSSKLSAWLAVGAITARQVVKAVKDFEKSSGIVNDSTYWLIFELLWRDYMKFYGLRYIRS